MADCPPSVPRWLETHCFLSLSEAGFDGCWADRTPSLDSLIDDKYTCSPFRSSDHVLTVPSPFLDLKSSKMPSAEGALRVFQASSTIAATGFITLVAQTILAKYRKRKSQAKLNIPVVLSAVTSGDELQKPTAADGGSSRPGKAKPDPDWKKPLRDWVDTLISQARSQGEDDNAPEITRAATTYLLAAESLLRLREGGPGGAAGRSRARLYAAASVLVEDTTAATASLRELSPPGIPDPKAADAAFLAGLVSLLATLVAFGAAGAAEAAVFGGQYVDLTRFTLHGEPRAAGPPPYLLVLATSTAACAFRLVLAGLGMVLDLVRPVVMYPANAVFNCLVSGLLTVGLPLGVAAVGIISSLAVAAMAVLACETPAKAELLALVDAVDEQKKTSGESCIDSNSTGLK